MRSITIMNRSERLVNDNEEKMTREHKNDM